MSFAFKLVELVTCGVGVPPPEAFEFVFGNPARSNAVKVAVGSSEPVNAIISADPTVGVALKFTVTVSEEMTVVVWPTHKIILFVPSALAVSSLVEGSQLTPAAVGLVVASAPVTTIQTYTVSAVPVVAHEEIEIVEPE